MKLITDEIAKVTPAIGETAELSSNDVLVTAHFFNPLGPGDWFLTELGDNRDYAFGLAVITDAELGYFSIAELESLELHAGLTIKRDEFWSPSSLAEVMKRFQQEGESP
jgi:hypothetical protein